MVGLDVAFGIVVLPGSVLLVAREDAVRGQPPMGARAGCGPFGS